MSIIHDALKKAQEERKKPRDNIPLHPSGRKKKSGILVYVTIFLCLCVALLVIYLSVTPKQTVKYKPGAVAQMNAGSSANPSTQQIKLTAKSSSTVSPPLSTEKRGTNQGEQTPLKSVLMEHRNKTGRIQTPATGKPIPERHSASALPAADKDGEVISLRKGEENIDTMYNAGLKAFQSGKTGEARSIYRQILARAPRHVETLNNLGIIAMQEGHTAEALFCFRKILEYQKNYHRAYNNLGLVMMKEGDSKLAEEYFRKAISLDPAGIEPYLNLSALLRGTGRLEDAEKLLQVPIENKTKTPALFLSYAIIKDNLGRYDEAARYYREYLRTAKPGGSIQAIIDRLDYIEKIKE